MKTVTLEQTREIVSGSLTPAGIKPRALNPQRARIAAAWAKESTPDEQAAIATTVQSAIAAFVADADRRPQT